MRGISRRDFPAVILGLVTSFGLGYFLGRATPKSEPNEPKSIDDLTDSMIGALNSATKDDVNLLGVDYWDNTPFDVYANIREYCIKYSVTRRGDEWMTIKLAPSALENKRSYALFMASNDRAWYFQGEGQLNINSNFSYHDRVDDKHETFDSGYAGIIPVRIRDLLDIDKHIQNCKVR